LSCDTLVANEGNEVKHIIDISETGNHANQQCIMQNAEAVFSFSFISSSNINVFKLNKGTHILL